MKWGVFSLSQVPDLSRTVQAFADDMKLFELAEELGYDSIWIAEHLFSTYGLVTSTQVLAAAIAQRTKRVRIGTAVVVIPFNHPLRTASDFALIDVLSHGRLDFGVGRAYQPHEFVGLGVPMEKSREMFSEGMDVVLRSWTEEKIAHRGEFWTIPDPVELLPKPVQQPHPPVYQATISPESFSQAAKRGWNLQFATPFTYRTYRELWKDKLEESCRAYEKECTVLGRDPKVAERMILIPFFVHEDAAKAKELYGKHVQWFYNKVSSNQLMQQTDNSLVKGYELTMGEGRRTREMGYLDFEKLHELGACVASDPAGCVAQLQEFRDRFGITEFALWFSVGGMPAELCDASMRLTMEKVVPYV